MAQSVSDLNDPRSIVAAVGDAELFARCANEFQTLVQLSQSLIAAAEQDIKCGKPALTFSIDLGVVAPLYYVCIKCTVLPIREQTIELLSRCPRREGMWDSVMGVRMIREFWEIQEVHRALQQGTGLNCRLGHVSLTEAVDLVLGDEMRWEWKWKCPETARTESIDSMMITPGIEWLGLLEDQIR